MLRETWRTQIGCWAEFIFKQTNLGICSRSSLSGCVFFRFQYIHTWIRNENGEQVRYTAREDSKSQGGGREDQFNVRRWNLDDGNHFAGMRKCNRILRWGSLKIGIHRLLQECRGSTNSYNNTVIILWWSALRTHTNHPFYRRSHHTRNNSLTGFLVTVYQLSQHKCY